MQGSAEIPQSGEEAQKSSFRIYAQGAGPEKLTEYDNLADLSAALEATATRGLVLYVPPVTALAVPLGKGAMMAHALAGWSAACENLLAVQRRYRAKLVVMELPVTDAAYEAAQRALAGRVPGMALPRVLLSESDLTKYRDFAALALGQDVRARALIDGLQAASLGSYGDLPAAAPLIEALLADRRDLEAEIKQAPVRAARDLAQSDMSKKVDRMMAQQITDLEQALKNKQGTLDELYASTSWRILEPVRVVVRFFRR